MVRLLLPLVTIVNLVRWVGEPDYHQPCFSSILIVVVLRQRSSSNSPVEVADRTVGPSATEIEIKENFMFHIWKCLWLINGQKKTFHLYGRQKLIQYVDHFQANQKLERKSIRNEESWYTHISELLFLFCQPSLTVVSQGHNILKCANMKTILNLNILASQCWPGAECWKLPSDLLYWETLFSLCQIFHLGQLVS